MIEESMVKILGAHFSGPWILSGQTDFLHYKGI